MKARESGASMKERISAFLDDVESGRTAEAMAAVAGGVGIETMDSVGIPALGLAAWYGRPETVKALIGAGADLNRVGGRDASTALVRALTGVRGMTAGGRECVLALLEAGADPNIANAYGEFALRMAVKWEDAGLVSALLAAGADALRRGASRNSSSALETAASIGAEAAEAAADCVRALGPEAVQGDPSGAKLCLDVALHQGRPGLLAALLECGVDPNLAPEQVAEGGSPPLAIAVFRGDMAAVKILLDHGARPIEPGRRVSAVARLARSRGQDGMAALIESRVLAIKEERMLSKLPKRAAGKASPGKGNRI